MHPTSVNQCEQASPGKEDSATEEVPPAQHFCLRWNNYQTSMTSAFENLRDDEDFIDVTLACEGKTLKAHRVVLSACSPYFRQLLKSTACKHPVIVLQDTAYEDIRSLVDFIYHGQVNVHQRNLTSFLKTAEALKVSGLTQKTPDTTPSPAIATAEQLSTEPTASPEKCVVRESDNNAGCSSSVSSSSSTNMSPRSVTECATSPTQSTGKASIKSTSVAVSKQAVQLYQGEDLSYASKRLFRSPTPIRFSYGDSMECIPVKRAKSEEFNTPRARTISPEYKTAAAGKTDSRAYDENHNDDRHSKIDVDDEDENDDNEPPVDFSTTTMKNEPLDLASNHEENFKEERNNAEGREEEEEENAMEMLLRRHHHHHGFPMPPHVPPIHPHHHAFLDHKLLAAAGASFNFNMAAAMADSFAGFNHPGHMNSANMMDSLNGPQDLFSQRQRRETNATLSASKTSSANERQMCPVCSRTFSCLYSLKRHFHDKHNVAADNGMRLYACEFCDRSYRTKNSLTTHRSLQHRDVRKTNVKLRRNQATEDLTSYMVRPSLVPTESYMREIF